MCNSTYNKRKYCTHYNVDCFVQIRHSTKHTKFYIVKTLEKIHKCSEDKQLITYNLLELTT